MISKAFIFSCISIFFITGLFAAESYLVMEAHSGRVLLAADPELKRPIAGLTKVATAKVTLDWAKRSQTNLSTMITVPQGASTLTSANPMNLKPGDSMTLRDALYATLLGSDDIAAYTLSDHVGRSFIAQRGSEGSPEVVFVKEMNQLAKALGMSQTKFTNSHGIALTESSQYSTASDVARLSVYAMRDTGFAFHVKQKSRKITVNNTNGASLAFNVKNTNNLLGSRGINGIKT